MQELVNSTKMIVGGIEMVFVISMKDDSLSGINEKSDDMFKYNR
ncbi:hypothetical protein ACS127_05855 [Amphibacillus sp. Q70]